MIEKKCEQSKDSKNKPKTQLIIAGQRENIDDNIDEEVTHQLFKGWKVFKKSNHEIVAGIRVSNTYEKVIESLQKKNWFAVMKKKIQNI